MEKKAPKNIINKAFNLDTNSKSQGIYMLTINALAALRRDMTESSAKMREELARRRTKD
ncbi:MAG: hypothetical protein RR761_03830 [Aeromonas sp.]|uniref:hypothetical protein n=1 Tax=Aeromonas sp. TaxID=647 RepID=UPI002FCB6045